MTGWSNRDPQTAGLAVRGGEEGAAGLGGWGSDHRHDGSASTSRAGRRVGDRAGDRAGVARPTGSPYVGKPLIRARWASGRPAAAGGGDRIDPPPSEPCATGTRQRPLRSRTAGGPPAIRVCPRGVTAGGRPSARCSRASQPGRARLAEADQAGRLDRERHAVGDITAREGRRRRRPSARPRSGSGPDRGRYVRKLPASGPTACQPEARIGVSTERADVVETGGAFGR